MKTVNSVSGGKTSSYVAVNYPADYNVFSLVRTNDKKCIYPDAKVRQIVSDKINMEFVGTLEQDSIIKAMLSLEQKIGNEIVWVTGDAFEDVIGKRKGKNGKNYLPNVMTRYCTTDMKMIPIFDWWRSELNEVCEMRIGYRVNEMKRAKRMIEQLNSNGVSEMKTIIGRTKTGNRNKWGLIEWRVPSFPLINDGIRKIDVENYWERNKDVEFKHGYYNNCVGCFHRNPIFLSKMAQEHPNKMEWFANQEKENSPNTFRKDCTYEQVINFKPQIELSFEDFDDCDSGFCGL
tara:strand:+ start:1430 stop:2299 length:870 start_codon:yes stop_codon:yes gene_type:complete